MPDHLMRSLTRAHYFLTLIMMLFPFLPLRVSNFIMIVWGSLCGVLFIGNGSKVNKRHLIHALLFGCVTVFYALDMLRAEDGKSAAFALEKSVGLLAIPLAMALMPTQWSRPQLRRILDAFTIGALSLGLWGNIAFLVNGPDPEFAGTIASYSYRMTFTKITVLHPTYAAIFFLFGALCQVDALLRVRNEKAWVRIIRIAVAHLLVLFALFAASRTPLIAFFLVLGLMWFREKGWKQTLAPVVITGIVLIAAFSFIAPLKQRYLQIVETEVEMPKGEFHNSVNVRYGILHCTIEILEENWILGTSAGDLQHRLNECYEQFDTPVYDTGNYNSHNQFLDLWMSLGLVGWLCIACVFIIPIRSAFHQGPELYIAFILFFSICCLTENLLARQWGVQFFAFFNALFFMSEWRSK